MDDDNHTHIASASIREVHQLLERLDHDPEVDGGEELDDDAYLTLCRQVAGHEAFTALGRNDQRSVLTRLYHALEDDDVGDEALAVLRRRNEIDDEPMPDNMCDEASLLLTMGEVIEADALYESAWRLARERCEGEVQVAMRAALGYTLEDSPLFAESWAARGLRRCLELNERSHDMELLVKLRSDALRELDREPDCLAMRTGFTGTAWPTLKSMLQPILR